MEDVPESHKLAARPVFEVWNGADTARLDDVADGLGYFAQRIGPVDEVPLGRSNGPDMRRSY